MSFGLYDNERRYRRRRWVRLTKFLVVVGVLTVTGLFAYQIGVEQYRARDVAQQAEIDRLLNEKNMLAQDVLRLQGELGEAESQIRGWEQRYAADVPQGDLRELANMAREKLGTGVAFDRLAFLVGSAANPSVCDTVETKRFLVLTPLYRGANTAVAFADGRITVTGEGVSAISANGEPEAWFDPVSPITLRFTVIGGDQSRIDGPLPMHHSVVIGDSEYRFTVRQGEQGFVEVTGERCNYP